MKRFFIYLTLFILCFLLFGWYFSNITGYLVISLVLAALLRPLTNRLSDFQVLGTHLPRWSAVLLSFIVIIGILGLLSLLFFPLINSQVSILANLNLEEIYTKIQHPITQLENWLIQFQLLDSDPGYLFEQIRDTLLNALSGIDLGNFISTVINTTSSFFIGLMAVAFITFFLLLENGLLRRNILNLIPNPYFELSVATFTKVEKLLSNYLTGLLIQMVTIFTIASLGLTIVGVEYALTIALVAAIANLIPYAGPLLGAGFGIIIGISTGNFVENYEIGYLAAKILIVFSVVQVTDNIFLQPLIFSKSVKAHPLEIFVIIFAGAKIAGITGMIFAIPVYTIFRVSIMELYQGYKSYRIFK